MKSEIKKIFESAKHDFESAKESSALYEIKVRYMGKKGLLSLLMKELKNVSNDDRPALGQLINEAQETLKSLYSQRETELKESELLSQIKKDFLDLSLPAPSKDLGAYHPISLVIKKIITIFRSLGYSVQSGPFVESDWYNFEALNIPAFHPSRDLQDTFYVDKDYVLRTHTSPVQIRALKSLKPPFATLAPGAVFRCDSDVSHSPMFHQVEGLFVDKQVSFGDLKGALSFFLQELFGQNVKVRFRPSYFPFTEPSAEYDVSCFLCKGEGCSICKKSGWIEIGGCGLVHPQVFKSVSYEEGVWQGFAFGLGVERIAMILYGIEDIRLFFENDLRFLKQFENA